MNPIKHIAILGGGTAGWIAAAVLCKQLDRSRCRITLVESEEIGSIGVGESTIPPFIELLRTLEIDERDFIRKTQATFKLGIEFTNWRNGDDSYFNPFGTIKAGMDEDSFYQHWLRSVLNGADLPLQSLSPSNVMARQNKFYLPQMAGRTPVADIQYALQLDAGLAAQYLRRYAEARGVERLEGRVMDATCREPGMVERLMLEDGRAVYADFFIDCSGFRGLLIEDVLGVDYCDWSQYLPCDRAVAVQTSSAAVVPPYTRAVAQDSGWTWHIPIQHRTGNGYVYSSDFCSDEQALNTLLANVHGELLTEPRIIPFKTGVRREIWRGNCLSLGLASGFIEPLESTAIHLVVRGMVFFTRYFPDTSCDPALAAEYNRRMRGDYEEIRDFIVLHYCLSERRDTEFWRWWSRMQWPESLQRTVSLFKSQGCIPEVIDPLFGDLSWRSVFEGMGVRPKAYSGLIDSLGYNDVLTHLTRYKNVLHEVVARLPDHAEFIKQHCASSEDIPVDVVQ